MELTLFWFLLLGVLMAGYAILDGFDLGVGTLHLLTRTDTDRRVLLNAIGPVWDGNEVWLVTFGGALFAAFPVAYAAAFSGFYLPFMFLLCALIFRAVALEFRSKRPHAAWRQTWDVLFFLASTSSALLFGTAVGAVLQGVPLNAARTFQGDLTSLVTPYSLLVGAFTVAMFALHGAVYLYGKTEDPLQRQVRGWIWTAAGIFFVLYVLTTLATVMTIPSATANFGHFGWAWGLVVASVFAMANVPRAIHRDRPREAFLSSALTIGCLVGLLGIALHPYLLVSSLDPAYSLTLANASSSPKTLRIMQIVAFIGLPFVLTYTAIIYWVFRGKVRLGRHSY